MAQYDTGLWGWSPAVEMLIREKGNLTLYSNEHSPFRIEVREISVHLYMLFSRECN